jgi:hypothetical protein
MAHPELPFELAKLVDGDGKEVLGFVRTWGLLGYDHLQGHKGEARYGDPVGFVLDCATRVKGVFDRLEQAREGVYDGALWGQVPSAIPLDGITLSLNYKFNDDDPQAYEVVIDHSYEDSPPGSDELRLHMQHDSVRLTGVRLELRWRALIDVIYWHLALNATGDRGWGRCPECGSFFEKTDPRQRFCPPPQKIIQTRTQSLCGLKFRARRSRERKRHS